ncbi:MAG: DNA polymerase I [Thiogranum sp.]|nr:DNA polymerase I [Thiogranum sp.]
MVSEAKPPLILVDGSSYLYRAFHVPNLQQLTTKDGTPTGAIYGVINMLRRLLKDYHPDHMAVVFDARGKTFRDELFAQYKANRPSMPDELSSQVEPLLTLVRAMGMPLLQVEGVEADDVIGTLAQQATAAGWETVISTGDKDLAQLVNDNVTLINTMTDTRLDEAGVVDKFGVRPEQIIDYLALVGDTSDNIPGVPGVGPKTAAKWLSQYGSLDALVAHADEVKGKVGERLRDNLGQLELSRELATVRCDLELATALQDLVLAEPDVETLREWFERLEFRNWLKQLDSDPAQATPAAPATLDADYQAIFTREQLAQWIERLQQAELFAFDTETTSLDYMQAEIVGLSFAVEPGEAAYVPVAHDYPGAPQQLERAWVLEQLKPLLEDPARPKLGHHLKYDRSVLANHGVRLQGIAYDSMIESYLLDSTASRHDLDSLCQKYLAHTNIKFEDVCGKGAKQLTFNQAIIEQATPYAAEDADMALRLHRILWPRLAAVPKLRTLFEELERPLISVLGDMERTGVKVDVAMLKRQSAELAKRMQEVESQAHVLAGEPFNLGSPKQIQAILYDKQELPVLAKTPKGAPSTAEPVLQELALDFPLPKLILEHRSLSKLKSTYTDKLPQLLNPRTGRVHTSYQQAVAATGRLSSSDPNLQNIPVRTEEGRRIRQAFVAESGSRIVAADYSQIELRIMAHLSGDEGLLQAFAQGEDIHRATAAEVFATALDQVTAEQRRSAKAINFGLIYGMSAFGLGRQLGIPRGEAQKYVDLYFQRYPGVKAYMDATRAMAAEQGYVETLFGRRLYLPDINARNMQRRQAAERTAINAPMQGTAADIIKKAMLAVDEWIKTEVSGVKMIMQVHDELVFEIPAPQCQAAAEEIRARMQQAAQLAVPLVVDVGIGDNWDEAH